MERRNRNINEKRANCIAVFLTPLWKICKAWLTLAVFGLAAEGLDHGIHSKRYSGLKQGGRNLPLGLNTIIIGKMSPPFLPWFYLPETVVFIVFGGHLTPHRTLNFIIIIKGIALYLPLIFKGPGEIKFFVGNALPVTRIYPSRLGGRLFCINGHDFFFVHCNFRSNSLGCLF